MMRSSFRKYKIVFYSVYFTFWLISIVFAFEFTSLNNRFGTAQFYGFLKAWAIIGLIAIFVGWIIENIHIYQIRKRNKRLEIEVLELKAELYNYIKKAEQQQKTPANAIDSALTDKTKTENGTDQPAGEGFSKED